MGGLRQEVYKFETTLSYKTLVPKYQKIKEKFKYATALF